MATHALAAPSRPRLHGRDEERAVLAARVAALAAGAGGTLLVDGPAGIGKSRLLGELAALADVHGVAVHRGAGDRALHDVPLRPLLDALTAGGTPVADAGALRDAAACAAGPHGLLPALQDALEHAALAAPVVVAVDDVHWADEATREALVTLPARLSGHAILWALTVRPAAAPDTARALRRAAFARLSLGPLGAAATAALARDVLGAPPDDEVAGLVHGIGGNPFLVIELLRGLVEDGCVEHRDGRARLLRRTLPQRLRAVVAERLLDLAPDARRTVEMAAVLGSRCTRARLALLVGRPAPALDAGIREALDAALLVEDGDRLGFRHDLVREAVEAGTPASLRRALRREAAGVLLDAGAAPREVADLMREGAEPGDRRAVAVLRAAAADLASSAPRTAADLAEHAVALAPADDPSRAAAVAQAIPLLLAAGRPAEARRLADAALAAALPARTRAELQLALARASLETAPLDAVRACRLTPAPPGLPAEVRAGREVTLTAALALSGDWGGLAERAAAALTAARAAGAPALVRDARNAASLAALARDDLVAARTHAAAARVAAARVSHDGARTAARWAVWDSWLALAGDVPGPALEPLGEAVRAAEEHGWAPELRWGLAARARLLLAAGRLGDARADAEAVCELSRDRAQECLPREQAHHVLGRVAAHAGDEAGLRAAAAVAGRMRGAGADRARGAGGWLGLVVADAVADDDAAGALLGEVVRRVAAAEPAFVEPHGAGELLDLLRIARRLGRGADADVVARALARRAAADPGSAPAAAAAAHARALVAADPEALRAGAGDVERAVGPLAGAGAYEDAARALAVADAPAAVAVLDLALGLVVACGAERDAARVRRRLRDLGVRRPHPGASGLRSRAWGGLTPAELAVAELVAAGRTNRAVAEQLHLSPHTVSSHLRHTFDKLGIRSRAELAARWSARDDAAAPPAR